MKATTTYLAGYRITATCFEGGGRVDCTNDALFGADLHTRFATRHAAESRAEVLAEALAGALQDEAAEFGLDPSTVYEVEERGVVVSDVQFHEAEGVVTAGVTDVGSGESTDVAFGVNPNYTERGIDGLQAAGELGLGAGRRWDAAVAAEILTLVRFTEWA